MKLLISHLSSQRVSDSCADVMKFTETETIFIFSIFAKINKFT